MQFRERDDGVLFVTVHQQDIFSGAGAYYGEVNRQCGLPTPPLVLPTARIIMYRLLSVG